MKYFYYIAAFFVIWVNAALAGEADVLKVEIEHSGANAYQFHVTVRHDDKGWDHYVNKWEVVAPDGSVVATRILHHPHVDEQPFTRSLGRVTISEGIGAVTIRAHDSVHAYGGEVITLKIPR